MEEQRGLRTDKLDIGYRADLIRDISFEVTPGKIVTLIGPNGCGKTTLLKTLTGELKKRGGTVFLDGKDKDALSAKEVSKQISLLMTYRVKGELMTCREVVEIGRYPYTGRLGILSDDDKEKVREAMEWTDTLDYADEYYANISDGQKQRVLLARAICQEPEILILDEPTSFLDIRHKIDILQKIKEYVSRKNIAVLMSLHELEIAAGVSDIVVALGAGSVLRMGTPGEVFEESFIRRLYHLEDVDTSLLGQMPWENIWSGEDKSNRESIDTADDTRKKMDEEISSAAEISLCSKSAVKAELVKKAKVIMVQGTMSGAGKSVIAAGLCRIFSDAGYRVAPFKSQNMALNSFVTEDGLEMGRAQVMQAECARIRPLAIMNPILLKPVSDVGSQVIVNGVVVGNMNASEYFGHKKDYIKDILDAYNRLSEMVDIIVVEGAGSPVEMNLKKDDIVNMGLARMVDAPVLLVGDIDRGGVFAQLLGTLDLLDEDERNRVKGLVVNRFRGDRKLFEDGVRILEEKGKTRVVGVVPYMDIRLDDEDSLSERFTKKDRGIFDIAVVRLSHISNYTDFGTFEQMDGISVRYISDARELGDPDMIIIPGSKNTIGDLKRMKMSGLDSAIKKKASEGICIFGICGGFQMLGRRIEDPDCVEDGELAEGLGLLPVDTVLERNKVQTVYGGKISGATGVLCDIRGKELCGYEIHMGKTFPFEDVCEFTDKGTGYCRGNVYGTYVHGFFDKRDIAAFIIEKIADNRGKKMSTDSLLDYSEFKEIQYDLLARGLKESLDMEYIYRILGISDDKE